MKLEDLRPNAAVRGLLPDSMVTVVNVQWFGSEALELTYKTPDGKVANELVYRHDEPRLELVQQGRPWSFDGDGARFRLVSEGRRFGDPGFYRVLDVGNGRLKVRYLSTLKERFAVYRDDAGVLRCDHQVSFLGIVMLRLHYKMTLRTEEKASVSAA